jgi:hypothetical protein
VNGVLIAVDVQKPVYDFSVGALGAAFRTFGQPSRPAGAAAPSALVGLRASVVGELGYIHWDGFSTTGFLGGMRVSAILQRNVQLTPFFQLLAGAEHGEGATDFAVQPGFGAAYRLNAGMSVFGGIDFRFFPSVVFGERETIISGGVSIPLGK